MTELSPLDKQRRTYLPKLPEAFLQGPFLKAVPEAGPGPGPGREAIAQRFPNTGGFQTVRFEPGIREDRPAIKAGVIFSGGQAPGGHNVIAGLYDALAALNPQSQLVGFRGGPSGLVDGKHSHLTGDEIGGYRNSGGFDLIGSGRTKLEKEDQFAKVAEHCRALGISAVVIIGGDDSNTNACLLAEYFLKNQIAIQVIGVPKTIDGDLKSLQVESSFGFDTATKVYAELLGNIQRDTLSAKKYWHFIKVMGRSASHIALECALQCHPNVTVISEEVAARGTTLKQIVEHIAGIVKQRAEEKMNFGVAVIPEGLIEFIPEIKRLLGELNDILAKHAEYFKTLLTTNDKFQFISSHLSMESSQVFNSLPNTTRWQMIMDRDPHGNVQVSLIETEKLLVDMVGELLSEWKSEGGFQGKFASQSHFFGYEGRCAAPSNFDADYCYTLGFTAAALIAAGKTGYMASVRNLARPSDQWVAGGVPLTSMMTMERRHGQEVPVIRKALVDLEGRPFQEFDRHREEWARGNEYRYPGPIQYFGPAEVCDRRTMVLEMEYGHCLAKAVAETNLLKDATFLSELGPGDLARLSDLAQRLTVDPGWVVIRRGEEGRSFYVVVEGELSVLGRDDVTVVAALRKGDPFGEIALLTDTPRTATVVAKTECQLIMLNKQSFLDFIAEHGPVEEHLCKLCIQRMDQLGSQGANTDSK